MLPGGSQSLRLAASLHNVVRFPRQALIHSATLKKEREAAEESAKQEGGEGEDSAGAEGKEEDDSAMEG